MFLLFSQLYAFIVVNLRCLNVLQHSENIIWNDPLDLDCMYLIINNNGKVLNFTLIPRNLDNRMLLKQI